MFSTRITYAVATVLALLLAGTVSHMNAPVGAEPLAEGPAAGGGAAKEPRARLQGIVTRNGGSAATVYLQAQGPYAYKSFTMKKSAMVVLDVSDMEVAGDVAGYESNDAGHLVKKIRVSQFAESPRPVTRAVFELRTLAPMTITREQGGLRIDFAGGIKAPAAKAEPLAQDPLAILDASVAALSAAQPTAAVPTKPMVSGHAAMERASVLAAGLHSTARPVLQSFDKTVQAYSTQIASALMAARTRTAPEQQARAAEKTYSAEALAELEAAMESKRKILLAESAIDATMSRLTDQLIEVQQASVDLAVPAFDVFAAQEPDAAAAAQEAAPETPADEAPETPADEAPVPAEPEATPPPVTRIVGEPTAADAAKGKVEAASGGATSLPAISGDPLDRIVNLDFRETELSIVVALLAQMAQVNVIGGTELKGTVTAKLKNIPLRQAFEIVLEMNRLGIVEDKGVFKIVPIAEARLADRVQELVFLTSAKAAEVAKTLEGVIVGAADQALVAITPNETTNVVVIAGPAARVAELSALAKRLDVAEPALPVVTEAFLLDYAETRDLLPVIETMLTEAVGKAEQDPVSRAIVVTDAPVVVEQVRELVKSLDRPVKQVQIKAMIVDAVLRDASQIGSEFSVSFLPRINTRGETVGNLENMTLEGGLAEALGTSALDAGVFTFGTLSSDFDIQATIAAEVAGRNAEILANPTVVTIENKEANINITQEFPYQELTQSTTGPPIASTEFKDIGVTLAVTPRVTNDNQIITDLSAKQSSISGLANGVPIEDKREAVTTLRTKSGQTAFIGGLRNISDRMETSKIPILGDVPVLNFLFKNTQTEKINTELLIFLTCYVLEPDLPVPTDEQQTKFDKIGITPIVPDSQRAAFRHFLRPQEFRDPFWKWRRTD